MVAQCGYDVLGRRIARRVYWSPLPGAEARETRYIYQGGQVVASPLPAGPRSFPIAWPPDPPLFLGPGSQLRCSRRALGRAKSPNRPIALSLGPGSQLRCSRRALGRA